MTVTEVGDDREQRGADIIKALKVYRNRMKAMMKVIASNATDASTSLRYLCSMKSGSRLELYKKTTYGPSNTGEGIGLLVLKPMAHVGSTVMLVSILIGVSKLLPPAFAIHAMLGCRLLL